MTPAATNTPTILTPDNADEVRTVGGLKLVKASSLRPGVVIGGYGEGGAGKTNFAASAVDSEYGYPALIVSMNSNAHSIREPWASRVDVVTVERCFEVENVITNLEAGKLDHKFVAFDHWSAMHQQSFEENTQKDPRASYGLAQSWTLKMCKRVLSLAERKQISFLFLFQQQTRQRRTETAAGSYDEVDKDEIHLPNAMVGYFPSMVPWMFHMRVATFKPPYHRVADFRPSATTQSKWQPKGGSTPENMPLELWNPSMASILDVMVGGKPWPTDKHKKPSVV